MAIKPPTPVFQLSDNLDAELWLYSGGIAEEASFGFLDKILTTSVWS